MTNGCSGDCLEMTVTVVDPDAIGRPVIIANVNVREPIAIQVAECRGESPIQGRSAERFGGFVEECSAGPWDLNEMSFPVVEIKNIRLAEFQQPVWCDQESLAQPWSDGHF